LVQLLRWEVELLAHPRAGGDVPGEPGGFPKGHAGNVELLHEAELFGEVFLALEPLGLDVGVVHCAEVSAEGAMGLEALGQCLLLDAVLVHEPI
jgi:hypothetical protein